MGTNQQFSLRWNNYLHHITEAFDSLREDGNLVDVTLCCEGRKIKAHKMLLSACSSYFRDIFNENPCQHPVIVFHNVKYEDLLALVSFMYKGEVNVEQEGLSSFLNTAELLEVQGLTGGSNRMDETDEDACQDSKIIRKLSSPQPRPESPAFKRRRTVLYDNLKKDHKKLLASVKTEHDFYDGDSYDESPSEDQKPSSLSNSLKSISYNDENMDSTSEVGNAGSSTHVQDPPQVNTGGSTNEMQGSLQAPSPVLHTCAECGKTFRHSGSLSMHKRLHIGDTYCMFCGRVFSRKYYLKLHMKMHHYQGQSLPMPNEVVPKLE